MPACHRRKKVGNRRSTTVSGQCCSYSLFIAKYCIVLTIECCNCSVVTTECCNCSVATTYFVMFSCYTWWCGCSVVTLGCCKIVMGKRFGYAAIQLSLEGIATVQVLRVTLPGVSTV